MKLSKSIVSYKVILCAMFFLILSCSDTSNKKKNTIKEAEKSTVKNKDPKIIEGEKYYNQYCLACHMQDGMGVPEMNPPLAKTSWVTGDKERLISVVLNGLSGDVEIDGDIYSNAMGSFAILSDNEIALILSYIRQSFGNNADAITEQEVEQIRIKSK